VSEIGEKFCGVNCFFVALEIICSSLPLDKEKTAGRMGQRERFLDELFDELSIAGDNIASVPVLR
jgi:hypothetical protein